MQAKTFFTIVGILAILVSIATWLMDLKGLVEPCIYCRTERTLIGVLGLMLLLPPTPFISRYINFVFGFFASHVASQQIFLSLEAHAFDLEFWMAIGALFLIIGLVILIYFKSKAPPQKNITQS